MKKIDLGQLITILANVGVIVGIALLVVELNQNNRLLRNEARYNLHLSRTAEIEQFALEPELTAIWEKANLGQPLSPVEERRYRASVQARLVRWEWYYEQYRDELIEESVLPVRVWRSMFESSSFQDVWMTSTHLFAPEFVSWMESNVVDPE